MLLSRWEIEAEIERAISEHGAEAYFTLGADKVMDLDALIEKMGRPLSELQLYELSQLSRKIPSQERFLQDFLKHLRPTSSERVYVYKMGYLRYYLPSE